MEEKRALSLREIMTMLDAGMTRKEINEYFGLNPREAKVIWSDSRLTNKKPAKYKVGVFLADDLPTSPELEVTNDAEKEGNGVH